MSNIPKLTFCSDDNIKDFIVRVDNTANSDVEASGSEDEDLETDDDLFDEESGDEISEQDKVEGSSSKKANKKQRQFTCGKM